MRVVTGEEDALADTAHRPALLAGPIRGVAEAVVVGDIRLQ